MNSAPELKEFIYHKANFYNCTAFIDSDPISIPRLFNKKEDIEISGFLAAIIAWGQRTTIIKNAKQLVEWMDYSPHDFIKGFKDSDLAPFRNFHHRTLNGADCEFLLWSLKNIYEKYEGLENAFSSEFSPDELNTKNAIHCFRNKFLEIDHLPRSEKHLANPLKNSAAKRINMFLRWMVRKDDKGVDFGIWHSIAPKQLICPLDVHSGNVARKLGLLTRKINDWQAAEELTNNLKKFDKNDPVKYDFALFGLGVFEKF